MSKPLSPREIENWKPTTLDEVIGCVELKAHFLRMLKAGGYGPNTMIVGPTRNAKSSTVRAYARTLACPESHINSFRPCGTCRTCRVFDARHEYSGLFTLINVRGDERPFNFYPLNCSYATEAVIRETIDTIRDSRGLSLVFLDEVHRLEKLRRDSLFLSPLEDLENVVWIAASTSLEDLDPMFKNRFAIRLRTSLPELGELAEFVTRRCIDWQIEVEPGADVAAAKWAERQPYRAICLIANAALRDRRLTIADIQQFRFHDDEI